MADRRFNRARYDAGKVAAKSVARLQDATDLDTVRADLINVIRHSLEPATSRPGSQGPSESAGYAGR